jgi:hypothetical protein
LFEEVRAGRVAAGDPGVEGSLDSALRLLEGQFPDAAVAAGIAAADSLAGLSLGARGTLSEPSRQLINLVEDLSAEALQAGRP